MVLVSTGNGLGLVWGHVGSVGVNRKWSGISLGVMWGVWESTGSGLGLVWGSCGVCGSQPEVVWD